MHLAACEGRVEMLELLWQYGAQCNIKDRWGGTPMEDAIKAHKQEVVTRLLEMIELQTSGASAQGSGQLLSNVGSERTNADGRNSNDVRWRGKKGSTDMGGIRARNDRNDEHDTMLLIQVTDDNVTI